MTKCNKWDTLKKEIAKCNELHTIKKKIDIVKMYRKNNDTSTLFQNTFWKHKKNDSEGLFYQMNTNSQTIRKQVSKCLKNIRFQLYKKERPSPYPLKMKNISKTNTHRPPKNTQIDFFREFFGKSLFFPYISRRNRDFKNIFDKWDKSSKR